MVYEFVRSTYCVSAVYFYFTEGHYVKNPEGLESLDCLTALTNTSVALKDIKEASSIIEEVNSWKEKLDEKYSIGQKLDEGDRKELSKVSWKWYNKLCSVAHEFDKEQRTLALIEERMKKVEKSVEPILGKMEEYMTRVQSATMTFVESSPTERSFEPTLRGLLARTNKGELILTGYFDQYFLKDFKVMTPKPSIKFISPELTNSKQDKINLDALKRLEKMGAEIRFHPMLHARMVLSPTEIIVGSADIKSDCLGGRRYDAGIWSNNPVLVRSGKVFINKVWSESKPLSP